MPSSQPQATPPAEAAEMYYLIGLCLIECKQYSEACDAFNNTLKIESKHAEVRSVANDGANYGVGLIME